MVKMMVKHAKMTGWDRQEEWITEKRLWCHFEGIFGKNGKQEKVRA